jgi:dienelactone hydrolase
MRIERSLILLCAARLGGSAACGDDVVPGHVSTHNPANGDGDDDSGDGDGDGDGDEDTGDGDEDDTGDGDGDGDKNNTGDGDKDTGDGDGDTGDGDSGDGDTGDGDSGDGDTGDGDGDVVGGGTGYIRGPAPTSASASAKGSFKTQSYTSGYRNGPDFADATVWYPTDAEAPFAYVAIVPGFVSAQSSISSWGGFLASHGIVAITIGTNSPTDDPNARSKALIDALKTLGDENTREGSPLKGKLDSSRRGVMGWSMGGGGTLITANAMPDLKAAVSLCGWSSTKNFSGIKVPSLLFAGSTDGTASTTSHSKPFYDSIPTTTTKMLYEVQGGGHSIANNPANESGQIGKYGLSWLKVFLEGDDRYKQFLIVKPSRSSRYETTLK